MNKLKLEERNKERKQASKQARKKERKKERKKHKNINPDQQFLKNKSREKNNT